MPDGFELPDRYTPVWRYLDLEKLQSVLEKESLHFASTRQFNDAFEGSISKPNYEFRMKSIDGLSPDSEYLSIAGKYISRAFRELTRLTKMSCWHMCEHESAAMWNIYLREGRGVAIQTTVGRLIDSLGEFRLQPQHGAETIWAGPVRYINYKTDPIPHEGNISRFFCKRQSFSYESEFRLAVSLALSEEFGVDVPDGGVYVPVNLSGMIERVVIAPGTNQEFHDQASALLATYRAPFPVTKSEMDEAPLF